MEGRSPRVQSRKPELDYRGRWSWYYLLAFVRYQFTLLHWIQSAKEVLYQILILHILTD